MTKQDSFRVSSLLAYDIDGLENTWKKGWKQLAALAQKIAGPEYDVEADNLKVAVTGLIEFLHISLQNTWEEQCGENPNSIREGEYLLENLARTSGAYNPETYQHGDYRVLRFLDKTGWKYAKDVTNERRKIARAAEKFVMTFIESQTYDDIVSALVPVDQKDTYLRLFFSEEYYNSEVEIKKHLSKPVVPRQKLIAKWLLTALKNPKQRKEAWWNCIWLKMEPEIKKLKSICDDVRKDVPIIEGQIAYLNHLIKSGQPYGSWIINDDQSRTFKVILAAEQIITSHYNSSVIQTLLAQPAFALLQRLQEQCEKPRHVRKCRSPLCDKYFYVSHSTQVTCPKRGRQVKSECKVHWDAFLKHLKNHGFDTNTDWNNPERRHQFLMTYKPRGPQSPQFSSL